MVQDRLLKIVIIRNFKKLLFAGRKDHQSVTLNKFIAMLKGVERIEYRIAMNKEKLGFHLRKWEKFRMFNEFTL